MALLVPDANLLHLPKAKKVHFIETCATFFIRDKCCHLILCLDVMKLNYFSNPRVLLVIYFVPTNVFLLFYSWFAFLSIFFLLSFLIIFITNFFSFSLFFRFTHLPFFFLFLFLLIFIFIFISFFFFFFLFILFSSFPLFLKSAGSQMPRKPNVVEAKTKRNTLGKRHGSIDLHSLLLAVFKPLLLIFFRSGNVNF